MSSYCHTTTHNMNFFQQEYTVMNEVNIQEFFEQTEEYLRVNQRDMSQEELDSVTELYEDLALELDRQQLMYDLYH